MWHGVRFVHHMVEPRIVKCTYIDNTHYYYIFLLKNIMPVILASPYSISNECHVEGG